MWDPTHSHRPRNSVKIIQRGSGWRHTVGFRQSFWQCHSTQTTDKLDYCQTNTWIKVFLSDRTKQVVLEGAFSNRADVLWGVLHVLVFCFFLLILMTCQTHSDPQMQNVLMMTAYSTAQPIGPRTTLYSRKTLQHWKNGNVSGRWDLSKCSIIRVTTGRRKKVYHSSYKLHGQEQDGLIQANTSGWKSPAT